MLRSSRGVLVPINRGFDQPPRRNLIVPVQRSWNPTFKLSKPLDKTFKRQYRPMEPALLQYILAPKWTPSPALLTGPFSLLDSLPALDSEIVTDEQGNTKKYRLNILLGKFFSHEDIKIILKDHHLTVKAKAEKKSGGEKFYQEIIRSVKLPEKVDLTQIKSLWTSSGILKIEAPLPKETFELKPTEIPIAICS